MILREMRDKWEKGLTLVTVIDDTINDGMGAVLVILKDKFHQYHLHRYVRLGERDWACSVDSSTATAEDALRWLNDPSPALARSKDEFGQVINHEVTFIEPYRLEDRQTVSSGEK